MANIRVQRSANTAQELDCLQTRIDHRSDLITISYARFTIAGVCINKLPSCVAALEVPFDAFLSVKLTTQR